MIRKILASLLIFLLVTSIGEAANLKGKTEVKDLRYSLGSGTLRIVLDMKNRVDFRETYAENPSRLIVSLSNAWIDVKKMKRDIELNSSAAKRIKVAQYDDSTVRVVVETMADVKIFWLNGGPDGQRLVIDLGNVEFQPNPELNQQQQQQQQPPPEDSPPETPPPEIEEPEPENPPDENTDDPIDFEVDTPFENPDEVNYDPDAKNLDIPDEKPADNKKDDKKSGKKDDKKSDKKDDKKSGKKDDKKSTKKNEEPVNEPISEIDKDLENIMRLKGKTIVIDAGHGGGDAGAIGPTGVTEKSVTLRVALELEELLKNEGAKVVMTRRSDRAVSWKGDKASAIEELQARCDVANRADAAIFISIHADSFTNPAARGTTGYYFAQSTGNRSFKLADAVRRAVCEELRTPSRGTKPCNFYVVRHTDMPATLIELAFISNAEEEELLDSDEGIMKAAQGILDGIEDYFG